MELRYLKELYSTKNFRGEKVYKQYINTPVLQYRNDARSEWKDVNTEVEIFE
jgi:hypothetical protein